MWPIWVEVVLGPFAETKGPRLPGRTPEKESHHGKKQQMKPGKEIGQPGGKKESASLLWMA